MCWLLQKWCSRQPSGVREKWKGVFPAGDRRFLSPLVLAHLGVLFFNPLCLVSSPFILSAQGIFSLQGRDCFGLFSGRLPWHDGLSSPIPEARWPRNPLCYPVACQPPNFCLCSSDPGGPLTVSTIGEENSGFEVREM